METTPELNFLSTLLPLAGIIFAIAVGVVLLNQQFQKNLIRQQLEQEELKSRHQRELLRASIEAMEEERRRIARDLHDELGAVLSITRMHLVQLENQGDVPAEKLVPALQNIRSLTETSLANMRRISHQLMPLQLEKMGLGEAFEALAKQVNDSKAVRMTVTTTGDQEEISWPVKLALYRMMMELLNNTIKHAGASEIDVQLEMLAEGITCYYQDNGKGLPAEVSGGGLGHKNLLGRAEALQGTMEFGNRPEGGFFARIKIPGEYVN